MLNVLLQESAENAMKKMEERVNGNCGIIALDKRGNFGMAFNTNDGLGKNQGQHLGIWHGKR